MQSARDTLDRMIAERGESCAALSRMLGRNASYLQQYLRRGSPRVLPERDRAMLARYFGVAETVLGGPDLPMPLAAVPRLDIAASAGPGGLVDIEQAGRAARFDPALLRRLGVREDQASVLRVAGDSMWPTLADGDEILVDRDRRRVAPSGGLYVVRVDGAVMVKRARPAGPAVELLSDNPASPDPGVRPDAEILGRVVWLSREML